MGGYADDLFNLFYRMKPRQMVAEGFAAGGSGRRDFAERYGVLESIEKIPDADRACTRAQKTTVRQVRKPGASPLVFGKFLMASTAFVTLEDIAAYLPSYEESVIEVDMDTGLGKAYAEIEHDIRDAIKKNRGNRSLMSLMMHRLLLYPDHPFGIGEIWGKRFNPTIGGYEPFLVATAPDLAEDFVYAKERRLIEDIRGELQKGRRCQVYRLDTCPDQLIVTAEQMTARGHPDRARGNSVHPRRRPVGFQDQIPFPSDVSRTHPHPQRGRSAGPTATHSHLVRG
jgi:hypothetical protein